MSQVGWKLIAVVLFLVSGISGIAQVTNVPSVTSTNTPPEHLEQMQLDLANGFFLREFYDLALTEYQKVLDWFPDSPSFEEAMYRIAECQRGLGKSDIAREDYLETQKAFPKGAFYARASFRLGEMEWNAGHFEDALRFYREAAERAESPETRIASRFYQARTLIQLKKNSEAIPALQELGTAEKQNPYRGFALLELARLAEAAGSEDEARVLFTKALDTDSSPTLRAESGMKAGIMEMKVQRWAAGSAIFEKVRKLDPSGEWIPYANLNLLRCYYQGDQYEQTLRMAGDSKNRFPKDADSEVDLLQSHALRLLRKYAEAARSYEQFLQHYPKHPSAESAAYERLICLAVMDSKSVSAQASHSAKAAENKSADKSWEAEAAVFLKNHPKASGVPRIFYLQADRAFRKKDYVGAAASYTQISLDKLEAVLIPEILYRHGYSLAQAGHHENAAKLFDEFFSRFPNHDLAGGALFQRGLAEQQIGKLQTALETFSLVAERFPKMLERETAIYRVALLHGELKKYEAMRAAFQQLIREYPKSRFTQDAGYWTGWSFFEEKKYAEALPLLVQARKADSTAYGVQATSRIILANYYLKQRVELLKEVDAFLGQPANAPSLAPEIHDWLATQSAAAGDHPATERHYRKLIAHPAAADFRQAARWGLAKSLAAQSKWKEAIEVWEVYQKDYPAPADSVAARLELIRAYAALKNYERAQAIAEEVMRLQPEGRNNAQARFLLAETFAEQKKFTDAGKYFLSIAVLYDDPDLTPRALSRAIQAFESAGETNQVIRLRHELKTKFPNYKPINSSSEGWLPRMDSNHDKVLQRHLCYRYTTRQFQRGERSLIANKAARQAVLSVSLSS